MIVTEETQLHNPGHTSSCVVVGSIEPLHSMCRSRQPLSRSHVCTLCAVQSFRHRTSQFWSAGYRSCRRRDARAAGVPKTVGVRATTQRCQGVRISQQLLSKFRQPQVSLHSALIPTVLASCFLQVSGCIHLTEQTAVLVGTLAKLGAEVRYTSPFRYLLVTRVTTWPSKWHRSCT